jgi:hypothetical protein
MVCPLEEMPMRALLAMAAVLLAAGRQEEAPRLAVAVEGPVEVQLG